MKLIGIRYCNVTSAGDAFADFFEHQLGLEVDRMGANGAFAGAITRAGASWVEVWQENEQMPAGQMLQLVVDDADAVAAHARAADANVKGPVDAHGERIYYVEAPDGTPMSFQSKRESDNPQADLGEAAAAGDEGAITRLVERGDVDLDARDGNGAAALHRAAFEGQREAFGKLVAAGADPNIRDGKFGATPAGWAIEGYRQLGALLAIEIDDFEHAIRKEDVAWARRFVERLPALRSATIEDGTTLREVAEATGNAELIALFEASS
ncbi:MAG: hypothetical protein AAGE01_20355 [Pseudomonadota bacterium]